MKISDLKPAAKSRTRAVRVGRGPGSGLGKTSGKGHKGQKARSGGTKGPYFEGGQMPLQRRLPKRGFKNEPFKKVYRVINLNTLSNLDTNDINPAELFARGIIKKSEALIKVLGAGELKGPLNIKAHAFSASAIEKINAAGGTHEILKDYKTKQ